MSSLTFKLAKKKVLTLLSDSVLDVADTALEGGQFKAPLLADSIANGLTAITNRCWKVAVEHITTTGSVFPLPVGFIEMLGVLDVNTQNFMPEAKFSINALLEDANVWMLSPSGSITFTSSVSTPMDVYYKSVWNEPSLETDLLECPQYALQAVILYAAAYALSAKSAGSALIRVFNGRVDSGSPDDNPIKDQVREFIRLADTAVTKFPMMPTGDY